MVHHVASEGIDLTVGGDAQQELVVKSIFTDDQITPGRGGDVVGVFQDGGIVGFDEEFKLSAVFLIVTAAFLVSRSRAVCPQLSVLGESAGRACEVDTAITVVHALASSKAGGSAFKGSVAKGVVGGFHIVHRDPTRSEPLASGDVRCAGPVSHVALRLIDNRQCLETAAFKQLPWLVGQIPPEHAILPIFRHVDDARCRIDCDGFVIEASHRFDGLGHNQFRIRSGGDFKAPSVDLGSTERVGGTDNRFFAADPGALRRDSAGAVVFASSQYQRMVQQRVILRVVEQ